MSKQESRKVKIKKIFTIILILGYIKKYVLESKKIMEKT